MARCEDLKKKENWTNLLGHFSMSFFLFLFCFNEMLWCVFFYPIILIELMRRCYKFSNPPPPTDHLTIFLL